MSLFTLFARLKCRRSSTAGKVPNKGDILPGELAINLADKAIFTADEDNEVIRLNPEPSLNSDKITNMGDILL